MSDYLYLAHHGVKGMRWGVRRYQNPDGSLTDEGRRRYGYGSEAGRLMTKNTASRLKGGAKIGAKLGGVVGGVGGAASAAAMVGLMGPAGAVPILAGYTFVSSAASGAISGGLNGAAIGGIVGAVETHKGRKYIERYDKGLEDFERREGVR